MKSLIPILLFLFLIPLSSFAKEGINIPVRLNIFGGYSFASYKMGDDHNGSTRGTPVFGADFNVPFKKSGILLGITGWLGPAASSGNITEEGSAMGALYLGYQFSSFDIFVGPGLSWSDVKLVNNDAAPDNQKEYKAALPCGVLGTRYYYGKILTVGLGVIGFYCQTSSYDKIIKATSSSTPTDTKVGEKATSSGAMLILHIGWDDERKLL